MRVTFFSLTWRNIGACNGLDMWLGWGIQGMHTEVLVRNLLGQRILEMDLRKVECEGGTGPGFWF